MEYFDEKKNENLLNSVSLADAKGFVKGYNKLVDTINEKYGNLKIELLYNKVTKKIKVKFHPYQGKEVTKEIKNFVTQSVQYFLKPQIFRYL